MVQFLQDWSYPAAPRAYRLCAHESISEPWRGAWPSPPRLPPRSAAVSTDGAAAGAAGAHVRAPAANPARGYRPPARRANAYVRRRVSLSRCRSCAFVDSVLNSSNMDLPILDATLESPLDLELDFMKWLTLEIAAIIRHLLTFPLWLCVSSERFEVFRMPICSFRSTVFKRATHSCDGSTCAGDVLSPTPGPAAPQAHAWTTPSPRA